MDQICKARNANNVSCVQISTCELLPLSIRRRRRPPVGGAAADATGDYGRHGATIAADGGQHVRDVHPAKPVVGRLAVHAVRVRTVGAAVVGEGAGLRGRHVVR